MPATAAPGSLPAPSPAGEAAAGPERAGHANGRPHPAPAAPAGAWRRVAATHPWEIAGIAAVLVLSAFLNLFRLDQLGYGNPLYAAAVRTMMQNLHAFWFAGFDSGGFLAMDKPPVGLWTQVVFAKVLGFGGVAILLPQALAGIAGVAVVYGLVRRAHGAAAALLAGAALAVSPISVTTQRNNTMDAQLVLVLLLAAWAVLRATEHGRLRWLLGSAALVGLGFEIKMLQAYLALPAIFGTYLLCAPAKPIIRLVHLTLAGLVLLVVSFAWPLAVDLTPPDRRPFIASTTDNSELSLIVGTNGLQRVLGRRPPAGVPAAGAAGVAGASGPPVAAPVAAPGASPFGARSLPVGPTGRGGSGPGTANANGDPGPLRLVNPALGPLAGWLLPLAVLGVALGCAQSWSHRGRRASSGDAVRRATPSIVLWTGWLAVMGAFFSVAGNFNNYYLITLAPAVAALAGIGVTTAWRAALGRRPWALLLLPALLLTGLVQSSIVRGDPVEAAGWEWLAPLAWAGVALVAGAAVYVLGRGGATFATRRPSAAGARALAPIAAVGVAALLAGPAVWASGPALHAGTTARAAPTTDRPAQPAQPAPAAPQAAGQSATAASPVSSAAAGAPDARNASATQFAGATREALILQGPAAIATFQAARAAQAAPQPAPSPTSPTSLPSPTAAVAGPPATGLAQATQMAGATRAALIAQGPAAIATFQAGRAVQAAQATRAAEGAPPDTSSQESAGAPPGQTGASQTGGSGQASLRFLVRYLTAHRGTARFMVAAPSALTASPFIIATGQPVMSYGGITGREQVITLAQFSERVAQAQVRYVVIGGVATPGSGSEISRWVGQNCAAVPAREWAGDGGTGGQILYDCAARRTP